MLRILLVSFVSFGLCQKERRDILNIPESILLTIYLTHVNPDETRNDDIEVRKIRMIFLRKFIPVSLRIANPVAITLCSLLRIPKSPHLFVLAFSLSTTPLNEIMVWIEDKL